MLESHKQSELSFYEDAYNDNETRRERGYAWEKEPSTVVMDLIEKHNLAEQAEKKRALDVGCGDGRHLELFKQLEFGEVCGVDFSPKAIELCRQRFAEGEVNLKEIDMTEENAIQDMEEFNLILDWSVLDHIREQYVDTYIENILNSITPGGYLIAAEFDHSLPGLSEDKSYKIEDGHYSKAYSIDELKEVWKPLKLIDYKERQLEDEINNYELNTVLMQNA